VNLSDLTVPYDPTNAVDWNDDGVVILKDFMPEDLMVTYEECWIRENGSGTREEFTMIRPMGWDYCTPYREHTEVLDILSYGPLHQEMARLVGEPVGVHLNLTGWNTTTRDWHQDSYLNPPHVGDYYVAMWLALDDVHPDSGPFQYIAGSHKWPQVTREKILAALLPEERDHRWPTHSERVLSPLFAADIEERGAEITTYLPSRGDVLLWHGRLLHRGSLPNTPGMVRKSLIAHYSGINHRVDMPSAVEYGDGWYFPVDDTSRSIV
jgi:hypothetical protein